MQETPIDIGHYIDPDRFARIKAFSAGLPTPCVVVDRGIVREAYRELTRHLPAATVYYAIKANPDARILETLRDAGSCFDTASTQELDRVLDMGVPPERCSFGNTIKKRVDIRHAYERGVRLFATDSEADLRNLAAQAPGSRVFVRLLTEGSLTADWPLSRKFGCQVEMASDLLVLAAELGLEPHGVSFHVGSQQRDIGAWNAAIGKAKTAFDRARDRGLELRLINLGGGLPGNYLTRTHDLPVYADAIKRFLAEAFGEDMPMIALEPGRSLCANAGVLVSEVVLISRKSPTSLHRWVYLDVGMFNGLIETMGEAIKYPIHTEKQGILEEAVLAGPTCDSMDILYEASKYCLPLDLEIGDRLYWLSTGAYTTSYSSIEFNGLPPLTQHVIG
jgi:ornithine decarboxylase